MRDDRNRNGRRGGRGGRRDDLPLGYFDAREAAMEKAEYEEIMRYVPSNIEAEAALLGALMMENRLIETVKSLLKAEHFLEPTHSRIYDRIVMLADKGKLVTPITLRPYFDGEVFTYVDEGEKKDIETTIPQYLAKLTGSGAGLIGARQFAQQIFDLAMHREIIAAARDMGEMAARTDQEINPMSIVSIAEERLLDITAQVPDQKKSGAMWDVAFDAAVADAEAIAEHGEIVGFQIDGYDDWNDVAGRMEPGDYILLGGRPSMGKTGVVCAVAAGAAMLGHGTDFLSLEMKKELISRRILANLIYEQGVTSQYAAISEGKFTAADRAAMAKARALIDGKPLFIDSPDEFYVEDLIPWLRARKRVWAKRGVEQKLCVIDYLERFAVRARVQGETERVSYISRKVKDAAKQVGIAIVLLCQLSRGVEQREDKRPVLSDLRQSGSLEQDADTAIFVFREEYYLSRSKPKESDAKKYAEWQDEVIAARDRLELYSAKRREGALTRRTGYFFANEQAVRSSTFYRTDLYRRAGGDGFDFAADGGGFGEG